MLTSNKFTLILPIMTLILKDKPLTILWLYHNMRHSPLSLIPWSRNVVTVIKFLFQIQPQLSGSAFKILLTVFTNLFDLVESRDPALFASDSARRHHVATISEHTTNVKNVMYLYVKDPLGIATRNSMKTLEKKLNMLF